MPGTSCKLAYAITLLFDVRSASVSWPSGGVELLRGQALPDMRDSRSKVAEYCVEPRLVTPGFVNFFEIGPKFLAVQRRTF
ncbi:hypothetical protein AYJ54_21500 [Bradyrhizobium centrolobii]|uniref:Uncharacterized protein n=1 Tax=Bradyrhizobium centrolobii TaxID=1505087 RepID=A0A176YFS7_9BRAD|nr:hypothetical protein AYJ54_21500 [Bradyrhizobium centrolobii]